MEPGAKLNPSERAEAQAEAAAAAKGPLAIHDHADRVRAASIAIPWLVEGILALGHIGALVAPPKRFKTMLAVLLSKCVALGKPFAGRPTMAGRVLYIYTDAPGSTARRLAALGASAGERIDSVSELQLPADAKRLSKANRRINRHHPDDPVRLWVVDTWDSTRTHTSESSAGQDELLEELFRELRPLAEKHQVAVLLLHHTPRSDPNRLRGSAVFDARCDWVGAITTDGIGENMTVSLETIMSREAESGAVARWMLAQKPGGAAHLVYAGGPLSAPPKADGTEARDLAVLAAVASQPGSSVRELEKAARMKSSTVQRALTVIRAAGLVEPRRMRITRSGRNRLSENHENA